ncbi:MAG TPA: hypothetical protein VF310_12790 [Vicinamibacteria bacterium]
MTRPTEAAPAACPVCAEPLGARAERCFRCETALGPWWELEDALQEMEPGAGPASKGRWVLAAMLGALLGGALGFGARRPAPSMTMAIAMPPASPPTASPAAVAPRPAAGSMTYRVQRGDSLWRIASALTGDGRRWRELWPEHASGEGHLAAGTMLRVDLTRLQGH